jgi:hypothetical protein
MAVYITNNFIYLLVEDSKAKDLFNLGLFDLFILHNDDSESLIESVEDIDMAINSDLAIGIEVGHLTIE